MIDFKTYVLLVAVLFLGLGDTTKIQKRASEFNEAFKGRDVNKTITRVEAILAKNPLLPRLTRGEILALFDNITRTDALKTQQGQVKDATQEIKKKPEKEKSLMVVLPFSANNDQSDSGLEELYTRQPVTRIVGQDNSTPTPFTTSTTAKPNRPKKRKNGPRRKPTNPPNQELRPVYVEENRKPSTTEAQPMDANSNWKPITEDVKSAKPHNNFGFDVPQHMKDTLDTFQNSNNQVFVTVPHQVSTQTPQTIKPTESSSALPNISIAAQSLTPELKNLLVSLGLLNSDGSQVKNPLLTTTTTHSPPPLIQYISINPTVDPASYIVFKPLPVARGTHRGNNEEELSDDMRHFLANFGLTSDTETYRSQKALTSKKSNTPLSSTTSTTTSTELPLKSSEKKEEITNSSNDGFGIPDFNSDPFTDDMKDVLENIGLMKKPRKKSKGVIFNPATRTAGLLNQSEEKEKVSKLLSTIKELSAAEKNKSLSTEEITAQLQNITASLVEESQEEDNPELELVEGEGSEMSYEGYEPAEEELLKLQNGFIDDDLKDDSPFEVPNSDNSSKINDLSVEELSDVSNKLTGSHKSLKDSKNPPDPLSPEELNHFIETNKNEVRRQQPKNKRQQPSNSSETSTEGSSSTTEFSVSTQPSSDDPKSNSDSSVDAVAAADTDTAAAGDQDDSTPSTDDLIDSFGGENPPENRPNGLYFLVDWNTFLRVGTDNKTVDLNFSPKVGNPKNFLPITVP